jgi:purine nucleosidase
MTPTRIVLDTDPGLGAPGADIDDGLAIALALRSPEVVLEALTIVVGNVDVQVGS